MHQSKPALVALLLAIAQAVPAPAQQALVASHIPAGESCAMCLAYLEFPQPTEAEGTFAPAAGDRRAAAHAATAEQGASETPAPGAVVLASQ